MNAWNHSEAISFLVNFSLDSIRLKRLTSGGSRKNPKDALRPHTHLLFIAPPGHFKSSGILKPAAASFKRTVLTRLTSPALVGSVDKELKRVLPAAAWRYRNGPVAIDEWADTPDRGNVVNALLQLTESGEYTTDISRATLAETKEGPDSDGLYFYAKDGHIEVKTRFTMLMATMHNLLRSTNIDIMALVTRTIPYAYSLSREEIHSVTVGHKQLLTLRPKKNIKPHVHLPDKTLERIFTACDDVHENQLSRCLGDLCRCYALYGWREEYFRFIIDRKNIAESEAQLGQARRAQMLANQFSSQSGHEAAEKRWRPEV